MTHTMRKTGLQQAIKLVRAFCKLYAVWSTAMFVYIDGKEGYTTEQKQAAKDALEAVNTACHAIEVFRIFYEA